MSDSVPSGDDGVLDLVGAIYDAALDAALWPEVLNRIGDAVGSPEVIFGIYDPTTGLSNLLAPRINPELVASLMDWAPRNPLLPLGIGQVPGKVFTVGNFITAENGGCPPATTPNRLPPTCWSIVARRESSRPTDRCDARRSTATRNICSQRWRNIWYVRSRCSAASIT